MLALGKVFGLSRTSEIGGLSTGSVTRIYDKTVTDSSYARMDYDRGYHPAWYGSVGQYFDRKPETLRDSAAKFSTDPNRAINVKSSRVSRTAYKPNST